ncbi:MATE family efflux transporter [Janthinobacterium agaricidamnosum]|uniref:MatE family protein n=1 Tax=Janthinobacterium agaricidamnosum NBRC 102515 = DSM 9628 TaxID=1349767 RepID=W0VES0_9BURK|nr:MATE family efflux transporter [Janthinobacterium agaricidamnosum]CDG85918.1 matE family protein [Janthinobacterium agaricidamnosum NBRC 102515 = DSM 9628]
MTNIDFTDDDVRKSLLRFSLPMMLLALMDYAGMFINLGWLMALTDESDLPATLRISVAVVGLLEAVLGGLLAAIYIYANQAFGRKDHATARYLINFGFGCSLVISVLIAASGGVWAAGLISMFGVDADIKQQVLRYLQVYWFGYVIIMLHMYAGLLARMAGAVVVIRRFKITSFMSALVLSPCLIWLAVRHEYDPMQAAALALIGSRACGLLVLAYDMGKRAVFPFRLGVELRVLPLFSEWKPMIKLGGAETLNAFSLKLSFYLLYLMLSYFEAGTLEAVTISQYFTGFVQTVLMGAITSMIPFAAQNGGCGKIAHIGTGVRWMAMRVFVLCVLLMLPFILLAPLFMHVFIPDPAVAAKALDYIRITSLPWACLMASFPFLFAIIGLGDTRGTLALTIWSMYICTLLPVLAVRLLIGGSVQAAAWAEAVAAVLTFLGCYLYYVGKERQLLRQAPAAPASSGASAPVSAEAA